MYRARIVFNAPVDREHVFYSVAKQSAYEVVQMLDDMRPVLIHAVSVTTQMQVASGWRTLSVLDGELQHLSKTEGTVEQ